MDAEAMMELRIEPNATLSNTTNWTLGITSEYDLRNSSILPTTDPLVENDTCRLFRFIFIGIVCSVICVLGIIGNTLSFLVYGRDGSSPVASFLLQSLAIIDNSFLILWMVHYSIREYISFLEYNMWHITVLRMYTFPVLYMAQMMTIWLTVAIAMNRYMAVCLPYRAPHLCTIYNVYKEVFALTVFAIIYNIPRFFELKAVGENNEIVRTDLGENKLYKLIYTDGLYYCFTFFLPLLILSFVNTRVICAFKATQRRRRSMVTMTRRSQNDHNITLVMIIVVAVFMFCQAPARLVQIIWGYSYKYCHQAQFYLIHVSNSLEVFNSSVNFVIYIIFRQRFTDILLRSLCTAGPFRQIRMRTTHSTRSLTTEGIGLSSYGKPPASALRSKCPRCVRINRSDNQLVPNMVVDHQDYARYGSRHANEEREPICGDGTTRSSGGSDARSTTEEGGGGGGSNNNLLLDFNNQVSSSTSTSNGGGGGVSNGNVIACDV